MPLPTSWAGLHADAADLMAEMEILGKGFQLFITPKVVEILLLFFDRPCRADRKTSPTGTALFDRRGIGYQRKICEDGHQADP